MINMYSSKTARLQEKESVLWESRQKQSKTQTKAWGIRRKCKKSYIA